MTGLAIAFALTAILYASVGFGGGSTYTALLALVETDYRVLPILSLTCNLVVVTGGVIQFARAREIPWRRAAPLCALSIPMAWLGGALHVPQTVFIGLLALSLFTAGCLMLVGPVEAMRPPSRADAKTEGRRRLRWPARSLEIALGGGLGLLSGLVGIGGGIFLSPILHLSRWARAKAIAGTASVFIVVNSAAGLLGQMSTIDAGVAQAARSHWPLVVAVLVGGQIGSRLGVSMLPEIWLRRLTALLVLAVAIRLFVRFFELQGEPV